MASINSVESVEVASDGSLYIADNNNHRIRKIAPVAGANEAGEKMQVPSEDGERIYEFSSTGHHLRTIDATTGISVYEFRYGSHGYLIEAEDADGDITRIERDGSGSPVAVVAPEGQRTELTLDANGYLSRVTNPAGEQWEMSYTADGLMISFRYPGGQQSNYTYDDLGRLKTSRNAEGGGWDLARTPLEDGDGYKASMISQEGRSTIYEVEYLPTGATRRTNRFPDGTSSVLERHGGITTLTLPNGTVIRRQQGPDPRFGMAAPVDEQITITTPSGLMKTLLMERSAELEDEIDLLSHTTLSETRTINDRVSTETYDAASRLWTRESPEKRVVTSEVDEAGRPLNTMVANLNPVIFGYDAKGRLASMAVGEGDAKRLSTLSYDEQGNLANLTDPLQRTISFEYDKVGRITKQVLPDGREVSYEYDANGNLVSLTPPGRSAHVFTYDGVNRETAYDPPEVQEGRSVTRYHYDLDGDLASVQRPDDNTVQYSYGSGGKLIGTSLSRGQVSYDYYPETGQLANIATPEGELLNYEWDGSLPVRQTWQGSVNGTVSRKWDNNFWVSRRCVNATDCVSFDYDNDGMITQAGDFTLTRNADNGLLESTGIGDLVQSHDYNGFGERTETTLTLLDEVLGTMSYQYDKVGRLKSRDEALPGGNLEDGYQYDEAGRLVSVTRNGQITTWQYDSNGNRTHENGAQIATYDEQDRLLSYKGATYTYTANGERQGKTQAGATTTYEYDELGNLLKVTLPGDVVIDYVVDGQNRRIGKKVNGSLTQGFLYKDQLNPIAELGDSGNVTARFIYGNKANVPAYMEKDGKTYRIISDHLGSPRLVVNIATGGVAQRMAYDVWGAVTEDTNPGFQPFGFSGGIYDQHTQLTRFGARDYDAETGRWMVKDPIRFNGDGPNLYGYVLNDPVNLVDPEGKQSGPYGLGNGPYGQHNTVEGSAEDSSVSLTLGAGGGYHTGLLGVQGDAGLIVQHGKACVYVRTCSTLGSGVWAGAGVVGGVGLDGDSLCSGESLSGGLAGGYGPLSGSLEGSGDAASVSKGLLGPGIGGYGAGLGCRYQFWCTQ